MTSKAQLELFVSGQFSNKALMEELEKEAGWLGCSIDEAALRGLVACRMGLPLETVSSRMDWRSFERFCGSILAASGFETRENLVLTRPRMQLDVVATDSSVVLSIDCKHWAVSGGPSALAEAARRQIERSRRLRGVLPVGTRPIVSALVTLTEQPFRFVEGAAVVPIHTLRDFAAGAISFLDRLSVA